MVTTMSAPIVSISLASNLDVKRPFEVLDRVGELGLGGVVKDDPRGGRDGAVRSLAGSRCRQPVEGQVRGELRPAPRVPRSVQDPDPSPFARELEPLLLRRGIALERVARGSLDACDIGNDDVAARAREHFRRVDRGRKDEGPDVARVHRGREPEQLVELVDRDVGPDRALERLDELRDPRDQLDRIGLLAEREEQPLLAGTAIEVVRGVARPGIAQRLRSVHVLDPARDVDPLRAPRVARKLVVHHGHLHVDRHTADRIDDRLEALEVDLDEVLDVEAVQLAEDRLEPVVAARPVVAGVEVVAVPDRLEPAVDLARVRPAEQLPGRSIGDGDVDGVARQAEHRNLLRGWIDRDHDHRVGVVRVFLWPLVAADEQDVQLLLAVPGRDRHVGEG